MIRQLIAILIVIFLGFVGFSLAIPLFPPLILDSESPLIALAVSREKRMVLLGLLLAMYPLGQFFGCPVLGRLSDMYGRKPILLISLMGIVPAYMAAAFAIRWGSLPFLFISRLLCGLFAGNVTIAQAAIADSSTSEAVKARRFGWIVSVSATGFIFGPLMGGKLASIFTYDTPFWTSALLSLIACVVVALCFAESRQRSRDEIPFKEVWTSIFHGFRVKRLRHIYTANAFIYGGVVFFLAYFSPHLLIRFGFGSDRLAEVSAYLSLPICLTPLVFSLLSKRFSTLEMARIAAFSLSASSILFLLPKSSSALYITLLPAGIATAMVFTYTSLLVSEAVKGTRQGHALGVNQSVQVFTEAVVTAAGGFLAILGSTAPLLAGALLAFTGGHYLFSSLFKKENGAKEGE